MSLRTITLVLFLARINVAQIWLAVTLKKVESPSWKERRAPNELALAGDLIHLKAESSSGSPSLSPIKDQLACSLLAPAGETRSHCSGKFWGIFFFGVQAMRENCRVWRLLWHIFDKDYLQTGIFNMIISVHLSYMHENSSFPWYCRFYAGHISPNCQKVFLFLMKFDLQFIPRCAK